MKKYFLFILFLHLRICTDDDEVLSQNAFLTPGLNETQEVLNEGKLEDLFNSAERLVSNLERKVSNIKSNYENKLNGISNSLDFTIPKQILKLKTIAGKEENLI